MGEILKFVYTLILFVSLFLASTTVDGKLFFMFSFEGQLLVISC